MIKFLLDANLSPLTAQHLRNLNFDVASVIERKLGHLSDPEIVDLAKDEDRVIITHDLDFGEIYTQTDNSVGVIVLRLPDQTIESVNQALELFLREYQKEILHQPQLVVIKPNQVRFIR